jgi:chromosome segregation ATPase
MALVLLKDYRMRPAKTKATSKVKSKRARDWPATAEQVEALREELVDKIGAVQFSVQSLEKRMDARFIEMDAKWELRFAQLEAKFEKRFADIDARFLRVDARFDEIDARFNEVNAKLDRMMQYIFMQDNRNKIMTEHLTAFDLRQERFENELRALKDEREK